MFSSQEDLKNKYGLSKTSDWLNLQKGDNKIRIVSDFVDYGVHTFRNKDGKYKSVVCISKDNNCPYCAQHIPVKVQFLGWVIDRKDGEIKLLKIGWAIAQKIRSLQESEDYGFDDLPPYDINIIKSGEGLNTTYTVLPARQNTPLTEEEQDKIKAKIKDPMEIIERMREKVMGSTEQPETPQFEQLVPDNDNLEDLSF